MSASLHSLQERIDARADKARKLSLDKVPSWEPLTHDNAPERLAYGSVLSFDQTLTSCGIALVKHDDSGLRVSWTELIRPDARGEVGFLGTYTKALDLHEALLALDSATEVFDDAEVIVHEMPSTGGHRTESALLAGYIVRVLAAECLTPCTMVANASMRALLVPPDRRKDRSKAPIREAVDALFADRGEGPWNEHVRDAVGLALTHLKHRRTAEIQEQHP